MFHRSMLTLLGVMSTCKVRPEYHIVVISVMFLNEWNQFWFDALIEINISINRAITLMNMYGSNTF